MSAPTYSVHETTVLGVLLEKAHKNLKEVTFFEASNVIKDYIKQGRYFFDSNPSIINCRKSQLLENLFNAQVKKISNQIDIKLQKKLFFI